MTKSTKSSVVDAEVAAFVYFHAHSAILLVMGVICVNVNNAIGKMCINCFGRGQLPNGSG